MSATGLRNLGVVSSRIINLARDLARFKVTPCRHCSVAAAASVNLVDKGVNVDWGKVDRGEQLVRGSFFHGIWLRHNCHCPLCYNLHSDQFTVEADELPNVRVTQAKVNG